MSNQLTLSGLNPADFQKEINGKPVSLFVLKNVNGLELCVTNFGAIAVSLMAPDKHGKMGDVVLGHQTLEDYLNTPEKYLGAAIGRYGNRIAKGEFILDGKKYQLPVNNGPNSLHGGIVGFNNVVWDAVQEDMQTLRLYYHAQDGEEGYPGDLAVEMYYTLTNDNEFKIVYKAHTSSATILNLTHHSFFNLSGKPDTEITNHTLEINADFYTPMDNVSIPTGEILSVNENPMDFRTPQTIGSRINNDFEQLIFGKGYDHNYVLNKKETGELSFAAKAIEPVSGRVMEVYTTQPGVQLYTGNWLSGFEGKHRVCYPERSAFCLETQHFPDSPNKAHFPSVILRTGEIYKETCIYKFGVE